MSDIDELLLIPTRLFINSPTRAPRLTISSPASPLPSVHHQVLTTLCISPLSRYPRCPCVCHPQSLSCAPQSPIHPRAILAVPTARRRMPSNANPSTSAKVPHTLCEWERRAASGVSLGWPVCVDLRDDCESLVTSAAVNLVVSRLFHSHCILSFFLPLWPY